MAGDEKNDPEGPSGRGRRLSDEELASLLGDDLEPAERAELIKRLSGDREALELLALAAAVGESGGAGFSEETIERLLEIVKESGGSLVTCPHCNGELHPGGRFCPHCGTELAQSP